MTDTRPQIRYIITDRSTGRVVARGGSLDCARRMGMTYSSFLTMASRARRGRTPYCVDREDELQWRRELARQWDERFGWYRAKTLVYPCDGCMNRTYCDHTGQYCTAFAQWFTARYNEAARQLRAARKQPPHL